MQLAAFAIALVVLQIGAGIADLFAHRQHQAVDHQVCTFAVQLRAGVVARQAGAQQETVAFHPRVAADNQIVVGKVVARLALKRQLAVQQPGVVRHVGGQARAGEVRGLA